MTTSNTMVNVGSPLPDVVLPRLDGGELRFGELRGKRLLLFFWGSWWGCRTQLPGWQRFYQAHQGDAFELVAIALEHSGRAAAQPFVAAASATFPTVVDEHGVTSDSLGFKAVPNGVLVDEAGVIRWAKYGGFSVENAEDVAAVDRFLAGDDPGPSHDAAAPYRLGPTERELVATKLRLGQVLAGLGRGGEAVAAWRDALRLDPENLTIRKQIWAAEHPEKFHPTIDWDWQRAQLKAEREQEIADGICGPDGCPVPWATPNGGMA